MITNDGTSWDTAFRTVQKAFDAAVLNNDRLRLFSIHIAAGLYKPTKDADGNYTPDDARTKTFALPPRVLPLWEDTPLKVAQLAIGKRIKPSYQVISIMTIPGILTILIIIKF